MIGAGASSSLVTVRQTTYSSSPPDHHTRTAVAKFHDERDILRTSARPRLLLRIWQLRHCE